MTLKRCKATRFIACIILSINHLVSFAYDFDRDGLYYNILSEEDRTVECCGGGQSPSDPTYRKHDVVIPSQVQLGLIKYSVVKIADDAWGSNGYPYIYYIENLTLPETIIEIGDRAFSYARNITSINIPQGLKKIGKYALEGPKIQEYIFPPSLEFIGENAFNRYLKTIIFTSAVSPTVAFETFREPALIGDNFKIYVPNKEKYNFPDVYDEYIESICTFDKLEFIYNGKVPNLNYINNLPETHSLSIDLTNLPQNANTYEYNISGLIDNKYTVEIPIKYTINKANLNIDVNDYQRLYGEENPIFKAEISGLQNNEEIAQAIDGGLVLTTSATESSNIGVYDIITKNTTSKNYNLSINNGKLTINKAPLSINANNIVREYGLDTPPIELSYIGLKNDEKEPVWDSAPVYTGIPNRLSDVGEYSISINCSPHNYEIDRLPDCVIEVTKAPLTVTVNDIERLYFEDNPIFDFSLTGFRNNDNETCLKTYPQLICEANKYSDCGIYKIIASNASADNYYINYVDGIINIRQRNLTASVGNYTKVYGNDNPDFAITYEGFVNGENESVLTNAPIISCNAEKMSDVGEYPITLSGGDAKNYVITKYNSGKITVGKADQTITWNQDLSNIAQYSQVALNATSSAGLPVTYEMSPNNVASLYDNAGTWYLDCYGAGAVNIRAVQNGDKNHNAAQMISKTLVVKGNGSDPSNPQIYLHVETAGTLPNLIADNRKHQIKNLSLTGDLNGTDINYLREMMGCDSNGNNTPGALETLDISRCRIVSGGRNYYSSYKTADYKVTDYMFYNCKVLVNLMLPENTTSIGNYAFADCDRLSAISIPDKVSSFGNQLFRNDISLLRIPMPNSLTSIGDYAFMGCNGLTEITIPAKVSYLGDGIVKNCQNIARINVVAGNDNFASEKDVLYTSSYDKLLIFPVNYNSTTYTVREGTTRIAPYAFVDAKKLNDVVLPESLLTIGQDAFIGCVNLSTLRVKALTPPVCDNECFEAVSKTRCELVVPNGCYSYYWVAPVWSGFNKIRESNFSSIDNISSDKVEVSVENRGIVINGLPENIQVYIFQLDGKLIYRGQSDGETLYFNPATSGTYLVVIANKTYKVMIR